MGTLSLYGGPKKTSLLPSDYNPEDTPEQDNSTDSNPEEADPTDNPDEESPQQERPEEEKPETPQEVQPMQPSVSWGAARSSMRKAMNSRSGSNVKGAIRNYTKALGGHANATRQALKPARPLLTSIRIFLELQRLFGSALKMLASGLTGDRQGKFSMIFVT